MTASREKILRLMTGAGKRGMTLHSDVTNGDPSMVVQGFDMPPALRKAIRAYFLQIEAVNFQKKSQKKEYERAVMSVACG